MPRRAANKKPRIKTSLFAAEQISNLILNDKMSPYSVSMVLKEKIKNKYVSSPRTIYSLIDAGFLRQNMTARHIIPGRKRNLGLYRNRARVEQHCRPAKRGRQPGMSWTSGNGYRLFFEQGQGRNTLHL